MSHKLFDLTGRTAVVIGGTSGIGRTLALGFAHVAIIAAVLIGLVFIIIVFRWWVLVRVSCTGVAA